MSIDPNQITGAIIGAAIEVHKALGPGLLESVYEACLFRELQLKGIACERQKSIPVEYKGVELDCGYRLDLMVEDEIIIEIKSCDKLQPINEAQLLTYLKLTNKRIGLLINFNAPVLKDGIKRMVNG